MKGLDAKVIKKHAKKIFKKASLAKTKAKESSSDSESDTDEERHKAYKSEGKRQKAHLRVFHPHIVVPHHLLSSHAKRNPQQTVESLLKASAQAKKQSAEMEEKGKELAGEVKTLREEFEKKDTDAKKAMTDASQSDEKAKIAKLALKRQLERLENTRHEAVHEASKEATEGVANSKRDIKELKINAKEEARKAAVEVGATAT